MELLFPLLLLVPLLLLIMRQRKQQKAYAEQQQRVGPGMRIMTTAGLYATVVEVDDDTMLLDAGDGVVLRWSKLAVGRIVDDGTTVADDEVEELEDDELVDEPESETVDIRKGEGARTDGA